MGEPRPLATLGASTAFNRDNFTFLLSFLINDDLEMLSRRVEYNLQLYFYAAVCKLLKFKLLQTALPRVRFIYAYKMEHSRI
jgi:hypothetical protein